MAVPAIALSTSPPSGLSSFPSSEFDFASRSAPSSSTTSAAHKPTMGGLSCLFSPSSSSASRPASSSSYNFVARDEPNEQLPSSYSYLPFSSSLKRRDQSPISILQGPVSCSTSASPPTGFPGQWNGHFHFHSQSSSSRARRDRLVPNALRSSTDSSVCLVEGFTTSSKEDSPDLSCPLYAQELLEGAQSRHKIFNQKFVINAFYEAERAHRGQFRASGDPYLQHCLETAILLANIGATSTVVAAGLLHDTLDDAFMNYDYISQMFGAGVADLVVGVSKLSQFSKLARDSNTANKMAEADRLHTMFLAMADARAVLIKLADRLHNMMTLGALSLVKQQRFAKETLEIFAPLANRLGISCWKEQLESLCFKHLDPDQHQELTSKLVNCFDKVMISSATEKLGEALNEQGVSYHVLSGRHKSLYSIYRKMLKKKLNTDEIHDIHGLRLIVEDEEDCYKSLDIVHSLWPKIPGKFKDYITHPKFNGYQSLHTVVMTEDMVPIEVQIRTKEMHSQAEYGIAAHWRYKEGDSKHSSNVLHLVEWARWVVTWHCQTMNKEGTSSLGVKNSSSWPPCPFPSYGCPFSCSPHSDQDGPIYVIMIENEKMSVEEFPANSTVKDVSIRFSGEGSRWSSYGFMLKEKLRPLLNYEPVNNINQMLKMGDVIELTPAISDKCLTECRKEIQRMYNGNLTFAPRTAWDS